MSEKIPLFRYSWEEAKRVNCERDWRISHQENCRCARSIEEAINKNFDGKHLNDECVKSIIKEFGFNRVMWVLAATIKEQAGDNRFSQANKEWADGFYIPKEKGRREYVTRSHPAVMDGFINLTCKEWDKLKLFDHKHCVEGSRANMDYTGQVLIVNPYELKDAYKTPEDQLFLATSGFGCSPSSLGRKVYGTYLNDGDKGTHMREDFLGVIQEKYLPDWAKATLQELIAPRTEQSGGMNMQQN